MLKTIVLWSIRVYQKTLSHIGPPSCRFTPSCSQYGYQAIERHGILKGGSLTLWRLIRCNPFNKGGYDPVTGNENHIKVESQVSIIKEIK